MALTIDSVNGIASATGMAFTWDDNGNLAAWDDGSDDWAYRYDPENRLTNVRKNDAVAARYTYDAGGRRVRSWDTITGTTDYVYSGLSVIDEVRGGAHEKHVYAGSMHLASNSSGAVEYYHVDHLGSTRLRTDASGGVTYESNYEPYGPEYGESGSEEFRYTGKQEDPTDLYYYGARYYDPITGRFTTRDSVFGDLSDPQSLNRYVYCRNNPHKYIDLNGLWSLKIGVSCSLNIAFVVGISGGFSRGIVISYDKNVGFQSGTYKSESIGGSLGTIFGVDIKIDLSYNKYDTSIEDVEGASVDILGEARVLFVAVDGGPSYSADDEGEVDTEHPGYALSIGVTEGLGIGTVVNFSKTEVHPWRWELYEKYYERDPVYY